LSREKQLTARLEANIDAVFDAPRDPFTLYWKIAADLEPDLLGPAQKRIRRILQRRGEIAADAAVLVACVLHLTGFPAHRLMHFLSLYLRAGISASLFEFAVGTIFLDGVPVPEALIYDMSRYTYLEKRLLARKSLEISGALRGSLSPGVLLYLYLLSQRDDLSNENIQLVGLVMKNCFPALEVRTRLGGASLDEYGDLARAWKKAEERTLTAEAAAAGMDRRPSRPFDRETASAFLDKYFSDAALAEMRAAAPPAARKPPRKPSPRQEAPSRPVEARPPAVPRELGARGAAPSARRPPETSPAQASPAPVLTLPSRKEEPAAASAPAREADATHRPRRIRAPLPAVPRVEQHRGRHAAPVSPVTEQPSRPPAGAHGTSSRPRGSSAEPQEKEETRQAGQRKGHERHVQKGHWRLPGTGALLPYAPVAAAALLTCIVVIAVRPYTWNLYPATAPAPAPSASEPAVTTAAPEPAVPTVAEPQRVTAPYVVRPGDSLWKIFVSQGSGAGSTKGWSDFLSSARQLNQLGDPNTIRPGKVLTIVPPER